MLLVRLSAREPVVRALRPLHWRPWLGWLLPVVAFMVGVLSEQIADRQHINVLAFPLLGIIAWNLAVYALMLFRPLLGRAAGPVRRWLADGAMRRRVTTTELGGAVQRFVGDWTALSAPLLDARAGRVLHLSAALLALGAVAGVYLRAIAFEYRIGWESTYLQAPTVHAILQFVLGPAARVKTSFEPGTRWEYSNSGFILLGAIVEKVSGESYFDYVRDHIYRRAGMINTGEFAMDEPIPNLAIGYGKVKNSSGQDVWISNLFYHHIKGSPAGGGFSTADDLLNFDVALRTDRLIRRETGIVFGPPYPGPLTGSLSGVTALSAGMTKGSVGSCFTRVVFWELARPWTGTSTQASRRWCCPTTRTAWMW